jgi:hypothetical protein
VRGCRTTIDLLAGIALEPSGSGGLASWRMREPLPRPSSRCSLAESGGRLPAVGRLRGAAPKLAPASRRPGAAGREPFLRQVTVPGRRQRAGAIGSLGGEMLRPDESLAASAVSVTLGRLGGEPSENRKGPGRDLVSSAIYARGAVGGWRAPRKPWAARAAGPRFL